MVDATKNLKAVPHHEGLGKGLEKEINAYLGLEGASPVLGEYLTAQELLDRHRLVVAAVAALVSSEGQLRTALDNEGFATQVRQAISTYEGTAKLSYITHILKNEWIAAGAG